MGKGMIMDNSTFNCTSGETDHAPIVRGKTVEEVKAAQAARAAEAAEIRPYLIHLSRADARSLDTALEDTLCLIRDAAAIFAFLGDGGWDSDDYAAKAICRVAERALGFAATKEAPAIELLDSEIRRVTASYANFELAQGDK
jgi:hypothetical protein